MDIEIQFEGHGLWGVGGGGIPEDGVYSGVIKADSIEYRGPRNNPDGGTKKLYFTVVHASGYEMYDNLTLPSKGAKAGVEKAFARFLLAIGYIEANEATIEAVGQGGLKGQKVLLSKVIEKMKEGQTLWFDFKKPRGEGDYKQTTYLVGDEPTKVQKGEFVISDSRGPAPTAAPAGATAAASSPLQLPTAGGAGAAPVAATPPVVPAAAAPSQAVGNLLQL